MLTSALKLKVAFEKMAVEDKLYADYFLEKEEGDKSDKKGLDLHLQVIRMKCKGW